MTRRAEVDGDPDIWSTSTGIEVRTKILPTNSLFPHPSRNNQVFLVSPTNFRKVQVYPASFQWVQVIGGASIPNNLDAVLKGETFYLLGYVDNGEDIFHTTRMDFAANLAYGVTETYRYGIKPDSYEFSEALGGRIDVA